MGELIDFAGHRRRRARESSSPQAPAQFFFDLASPYSYFAAERVEREFAGAVWLPATNSGLAHDYSSDEPTDYRLAAKRRALELRLPLVWPDDFPSPVPAAMRAVSVANDCGRGAQFVLAAFRLAFGGGFDLNDQDVIGEAAAAAGVSVLLCIAAARDESRDCVINEAGEALVAAGVNRLPALRIGQLLFVGESGVDDAVEYLADQT